MHLIASVCLPRDRKLRETEIEQAVAETRAAAMEEVRMLRDALDASTQVRLNFPNKGRHALFLTRAYVCVRKIGRAHRYISFEGTTCR